jgi:hypothetical protein
VEHRPSLPDGFRPGIAIVGCGRVVRRGHLSAYRNFARHNLLSLELTLAACRSAEQDGRPVSVAATGTLNARS